MYFQILVYIAKIAKIAKININIDTKMVFSIKMIPTKQITCVFV